MFYRLARPIARYVLRYYYRHLDISGLEHIPARGPVIFASNHPTAFIEPCLLACFQPRLLYFLARGDLFTTGFFKFLLGSVNILPVFRLKDGGYGRLKDNFSTFDACYDRLSKGGAIMILAEGSTIHEKRLRPLRKGTGRIALGALKRDPSLKDVPIIPVGVHFNKAERIRGQVMIEFGTAMSARDYYETYEENANQGVANLTNALREELSKLVVQVPSIEQDGLAEAVFELDRSNHREQIKYGIGHDGEQLARIRALGIGLPQVGILPPNPDSNTTAEDRSGETKPSSGHWLAEGKIHYYFNRLHQYGLEDAAVAGVFNRDYKLGAWDFLQAFLAIPILLFWLPIWLLAEWIAASFIKAVEFYSPVRFGVVSVGSMLYVPLWLGFAGITAWSGGSLVSALLVLAYIGASIYGCRWAIQSWERVWRWRAVRRYRRLIPPEKKIMDAARKAAVDEVTHWMNKARHHE
ncbi:MAG: 1-acyl-sn-glycerol-3-phosphate acyltransferase [Bacteroidota bacterium]